MQKNHKRNFHPLFEGLCFYFYFCRDVLTFQNKVTFRPPRTGVISLHMSSFPDGAATNIARQENETVLGVERIGSWTASSHLKKFTHNTSFFPSLPGLAQTLSLNIIFPLFLFLNWSQKNFPRKSCLQTPDSCSHICAIPPGLKGHCNSVCPSSQSTGFPTACTAGSLRLSGRIRII